MRAMALDIISEGLFGDAWGATEDYSESNVRAHALSELMLVLHRRATDFGDRRWRASADLSGEEHDEASRWRSVLVPFVRSEITSASEAYNQSAGSSMLTQWVRQWPSLSDDDLENLCLTFLTMGHENISTSIAWTLIQLAENQEAQRECRAEVLTSHVWQTDSAMPSDADGLEVFRFLSRLKLADAAFLESSRLFPSVPAITRMATKDVVVAGYRIPSGTEVVFNIYGLNRDCAAWGEAASAFVLHRPSSSSSSLSSSSSSECLHSWSFGGGQRVCLGRPLSVVEIKAALAVVLSRFELSSGSGPLVKPNNLVSLRPGAHAIRFSWRAQASKL
mmetsp:Transcript_104850/g.338121  ORF Transcript_104850/g.338121 Transcript_104850/m.338121 type:complete len:334 (-) Transcript_104850:93-1094(-)